MTRRARRRGHLATNKAVHMPQVQRFRAAGSNYFRGVCICGETSVGSLLRQDADRWTEQHGLPESQAAKT